MGIAMKPNSKRNGIQFGKSFKKLNRLQKAILILSIMLLAFSSFPIVLVLLIGLLPTITIMITDKQNYDKQMIVGCFNIAGVFFYLFNILNNFSVHHAVTLIGDIFNLILMLVSAGIGLVLYNEVPGIYAAHIKTSHQKRIEKINERLEKLAEEWGTELNKSQIPHR